MIQIPESGSIFVDVGEGIAELTGPAERQKGSS
jgi:hypothetical protein